MPEQTFATPTTSARRTQQRTLPLSKIIVAEGFNPRQLITRDGDYNTLVATVRDRGILQPIRVRETGNGDYVVVAGHRRHAAAIDAALMELPCVVIAPGTGDDAEEAELRVDALIENDVRVDLSPLDRAVAYAQLRCDGLTVRGIAQRLSTTQARVKEHLLILEVPEDLHPRVADRSIPLHAIRGLAQLAKLHPELPALATARVLASLASDEPEPLRWVDFAADPIAAPTASTTSTASCLRASTTPAGPSSSPSSRSTPRPPRRWKRSPSSSCATGCCRSIARCASGPTDSAPCTAPRSRTGPR